MSIIEKSGSYPLFVIDDEVPTELRSEVFEFLLDSEYHVNFYDQSHSNWYPRENKWVTPRNFPAAPRCPLAWDEASLETRAPAVYKLWKHINGYLGEEFAIEGIPEALNYMVGISPLSGITRADGTPGKPNVGWRVYGDGQEHEFRARSKAIHRDNPFMDDPTAYTMVYFSNMEWHPQYYGETLFHSNNATTGDFTGKFEQDQPRNFPIGDVENVVAPRPGRIMLFDSRYLHQIKSVAIYAPENIMAVSFRIKKVKNLD
jgi:hypothetical protein